MSRSGKKFGNRLHKELKERGYHFYSVLPEADQVGGVKCFASLASLPERVDGLLVVVPPDRTGQVLHDAATAGIRNIWFQPGADSPKVLAIRKELDLNLVSEQCVLMYAPYKS